MTAPVKERYNIFITINTPMIAKRCTSSMPCVIMSQISTFKNIIPIMLVINFYGQYHFDPRQTHPLDQLREMRHPIAPDSFLALWKLSVPLCSYYFSFGTPS